MKAIFLPPAPTRGNSSISLKPASRAAWRASSISGTAYATRWIPGPFLSKNLAIGESSRVGLRSSNVLSPIPRDTVVTPWSSRVSLWVTSRPRLDYRRGPLPPSPQPRYPDDQSLTTSLPPPCSGSFCLPVLPNTQLLHLRIQSRRRKRTQVRASPL